MTLKGKKSQKFIARPQVAKSPAKQVFAVQMLQLSRVYSQHFFFAPFQDLRERSGVEISSRCQSGCFHFFFGNSTTVDGTQEVVEQALTGSGVVKYIAHKSGLGCLFQ